jgi:ATP sulfurylase
MSPTRTDRTSHPRGSKDRTPNKIKRRLGSDELEAITPASHGTILSNYGCGHHVLGDA